jgi:cytochrome b
VFHWSLAAAFAGAWLTRDARYLYLHEFFGYAMAALVAFRVAWGFAGTRWARFASFPLAPREALAYLWALLHARPGHYAGHNPAGSVAIYMLLALAALAAATGLVTLGAEKHLGPLAGVLDYRAGDVAHALHEWLADAMLGVVAVHIVGVIVGSVVERENLAGAMVTGRKRAQPGLAVEARGGVAWVVGALLAVAAVAAFRSPAEARVKHAAPEVLAQDARWQSECASCHIAYHPSLLPARSWRRVFAEQHAHFGEDLALEDDTLQGLEAFAIAHSADALESPVAWKMATLTPAAAAPDRVSETPYWRERHARFEPQTWKRVAASDCGACHRDAERGTFSPAEIHVDLERAPKKAKAA